MSLLPTKDQAAGNPVIPTKDQASGIFERVMYGVALAAAMKFVQWGWLDAESAPYVAGGIVTLIGGAWAFWINRPKAIAQAAANIPNTIVITTPEIAAATPNQSNIVSSTDMKAINK